MNDPARQKCYDEIRACMKHGMAEYYSRYPNHIYDDRSKLALEHSMRGLKCIIDILDGYLIREKPGPDDVVDIHTRRSGDGPGPDK